MTAIASLFNVPGTDEELAQWSFAHAAHHRDIIRRIRELGGPLLPEFILDPMDPRSIGIWTYQHQTAHEQFDAVLGIEASDLTGLSFEDKSEFAGWIFLNSSEHYIAANILGIG